MKRRSRLLLCLRSLQPCVDVTKDPYGKRRDLWLTYAFDAHGRQVFSLQFAHS